MFPHEEGDFGDLLQIVATERRLSPSLVEKDYWVTHTLWALHAAGFEVWFKGGTSLSKGFALIERFSEDLDLKIEPGAVRDLPTVSNWKSSGCARWRSLIAGVVRKSGCELVDPRINICLSFCRRYRSWFSLIPPPSKQFVT